jgi:GrpB-like predicted nucleotidyltransferase (UPF0157 family)
MEQSAITILPYEVRPARCEPQEAGASAAAGALIQFLRQQLPQVTIEHIGSTAVPGCAGKGIVDLVIEYPEGQLVPVREQIDRLGFQRQTTREPFPEERPMRTGAFEHEGHKYLVHLHVVSNASPDVEDMRYFRDCLKADPELRSAYVAFKKKLLARGVTDSTDYAIAKGEFISQCLGR